MAYKMRSTQAGGVAKLDMINYGLPDTEKTLAIARLQALGFTPLVLACDPGGMTTLMNFDIQCIEIDKVSDMKEFLQDVRSGKFRLNSFNLVCVDGLSNFSYMCLKETGESANDRRLDYGRANIDFRKCLDDVRRIPMNVYCNAFEAELKNAPEGAKF